MFTVKGRSGKYWLSLGTLATLTAFGLSSCSTDESAPVSVGQSPPELAVVSTQTVGAPDWGHVHNLSLIEDVVYIGSHEGFWKQEIGQEPTLLSQPTFDVMGLAGTDQRWLASGHPGPNMAAPADLGLIESRDKGSSWQSVSLLGEVDFHRLVAVGDSVMGITALDNSLFRSTDSGRTWSDLGISAIFDLAINPSNPAHVFATTPQGAIESLDRGSTFTPVVTPTPLLLVAWDELGLLAASTQGQILFSSDDGANWSERGSLGGEAVDLAVDGVNVVGVVNDSILGSTDGGLTFSKRIGSAGSH